MRRIAVLLVVGLLLFAPSARADTFGIPLTFQGSTAVLTDAFGPLGFMFNVDQFSVNGVVYTPQTAGVLASIYVFDDGTYEGWGNATYVSGAKTFTFSGLVGENPCYTTSAIYGGAGDPNCDVGPLPAYNTGWLYGGTTNYPVLPLTGVVPPYYTFQSPTSAAYLDNFAATFGGQNPPTDLTLALRYDQLGITRGIPSISYLTNDVIPAAPAPVPEPASALLLGLGFLGVASIARRRVRE